MQEERVIQIMGDLSAGNEDMGHLLAMIYREGKPLIDRIPDGSDDIVARKMLQAAGFLVKRRIPLCELREQKQNYWNTESGRLTQARISDYMTSKRVTIG